MIKAFVEDAYRRYEVVNFSRAVFMTGVTIRSKYQYSYYDSLIIATALESKCNILYSEDMHHGQIIENSLKIINPFENSHK